MQLKKNPQIDVIDKEAQNLEKIFPSEKQYNKKSKSGGGLLLRILLIYFPLCSILAAIALPSFLRCENKAKGSEAKGYVGAMNRTQQEKFAENGTFANSVDELGLGIKTKTKNFRYSVNVTKNAAFSYGIPNRDPSENAYFSFFKWNEKVEARSYVGAVFLVTSNYTKQTSTVAITCVTTSPTKTQPPNPIFNNANPTCANGTEPPIG